MGAAIGAKAETERYRVGFLSAHVRAPWPPMEWPKIPRALGQAGKRSSTTDGSSSVTYVYVR